MANYTELKSAISSVIKQNGNNEITGTIMQNVLLSVLNELSTGAIYAGLATPNTNPGIPDGNKFYIATQAGIYLNFGAYELKNGIAIISNVSGSWVVQSIDVQSGTETTMEYVKSIFKKKATLVSQVFNGATFNAGTSTTTIPAGQTGAGTTFEALTNKIENRRVYLAFLVKITGTSFAQFSFIPLPTDATVSKTYILSDTERLYLTYLDGVTGTREFDTFLQKNDNPVTAETKIQCIDVWTWNEPIGYNLSQDFQVEILKSLLGIDAINADIDAINADIDMVKISDNTLLSPRMQLLNGATRQNNKLVIPAGQTGASTTFEFIKPQDANKTIMLSVRVISTGAPLLEAFSAMYLPSNAVQELFKVSDYEYVVKLRLSGTGTREFDLYFQKRGNIFSNDVTLEVLETAYYEQPINPAVYNPFPIDIIKSKSTFTYKRNNDILQSMGELYNGAIWIKNGFRIPAGNTGNSTYIRTSVMHIPNVKGYAEIIFNTGGIPINSFDIKVNLQKVTKTIVDVGESIYRITIPLNTYMTNAVYLTFQKIAGTTVAVNTDVTVDSVLYYSYDDIKGISISQYFIEQDIKENENSKTTIKTITCAAFGTADFVGVNCIQDAIDSITDASETNRYRVYVKNGYYYVTNSSQYKGYPGYPSMICMKDWVELVGETENGVIIHAELPFEDADIDTQYTRIQHQTMYNWAEWGNVRNLTLVGKNIRSTIHMDNGNAANKTRTYENVTVIFEGTKGYLRCFGLGTVSGEKNILRNVKMLSSTGGAFSCHNNTNFSSPAIYDIENCLIGDGFVLQNNGSQKDCEFHFVGNKFPAQMDYDELWLKANPAQKFDNFNHAETKVTGYGNNPFFFNNIVYGYSLLIKSKTVGNNSSVKFDASASAFDILIKNPNIEIGAPTKSDRSYYIQDGYYIFEGSDDCNAFAFGCIDISESIATYETVNYTSMGKRLGDCSATNKTLIIIIDGVTYNVVFNKDYTNISNNDIIAEINTVIGSVADVSQYTFGREYYQEFTDCVAMVENITNTYIPKGSVVKLSGRNVIGLANDWDNIGVMLDDLPIRKPGAISAFYGFGRVLVKGILPHDKGEYSHYVKVDSIPQITNKLSVINGIITVDENGEKDTYANGLILFE